ncbi:MAG: T9SS type A sorting domain-containing protein, partial [Chlorobi bacterium]|nr:T9SS type A sorting domain-containing protein [Chlorobiota bacterium]
EHDWETIGFVEGHGNSNSPNSYNFVDEDLTGGNHFAYRLKQIDMDGAYEYSDLVELNIVPKKYELSQNYPNPFNPSTTIKFSLPKNSKVRLDIYNMLGESVTTLIDKEMDAGFQSVQFNASNLASGIYFYICFNPVNLFSLRK